jgi:hypothetical protein
VRRRKGMAAGADSVFILDKSAASRIWQYAFCAFLF